MAGILRRWRTRALRSSQPTARLRAIEKLAASRDAQSLALLTDALHDEAPEVRIGAAKAIADRGDVQGLRPMIASLLSERDLDVRDQIVEAVASFGVLKAKPLLLMALDEPHLPVQKTAAWALQTICWPSLNKERRAQIAIVHADWDEVVRYGMAAVKPLSKLLKDGSAHARRSAAKALGEIGTVESYKALIAVVDDDSLDHEVRKTAAWAFRSFSWKWIDDAHLAIIAVLLEDWSAAVNLGPTAVRALTGALQDKTTRVRQGAAEALGEIATQEAIDALIGAHADDTQEYQVRAAAAKSLEKIALGMLGFPDMAVRNSAAHILDELNWKPQDDTQRALLAIAQGEWDALHRMGATAVEALFGLIEQSLGCKEVAATLVHLLNHEPDCFSTLQLRTLAKLPDFPKQDPPDRKPPIPEPKQHIPNRKPRTPSRVVRRRAPGRPTPKVSCEEIRQAAQRIENRRPYT